MTMNKVTLFIVSILSIGLMIGLSGCSLEERESDEPGPDTDQLEESSPEPTDEPLPDIDTELDEMELDIDESALDLLADW